MSNNTNGTPIFSIGGREYPNVSQSKLSDVKALRNSFLPYKIRHQIRQVTHDLIADTFVKKGAATNLQKGLGYGAAAASGSISGWLAQKFLPQKVQGTARKAAIGGAGVGGAFLPSLVSTVVKKVITRH